MPQKALVLAVGRQKWKKKGVELTILLVVGVAVISKADWNSGRKASPRAGEQKAAEHDDVIHL